MRNAYTPRKQKGATSTSIMILFWIFFLFGLSLNNIGNLHKSSKGCYNHNIEMEKFIFHVYRVKV